MNDEAPVRLCCFKRHWGAICPDGKVMCCLCFGRFEQSELNVGADGIKEDVCKPCAIADARNVVPPLHRDEPPTSRGDEDATAERL